MSTNASSNLVAIVGRPNVGKSTLFNRLIGERRSIVGDEPGITRDRIYGQVEWAGAKFSLIDTGGIVPDDDAVIPANIFKQAGMAIEEAPVLIWVVDARTGVTQLDEELAALLRATGKKVLVAANKTDSARLESESTEFYRFGFDEVFPISAEQGIGIGDLLDSVVELLQSGAPQAERGEEAAEARELRLAIVGRPNVGKSSLLNRILGEDRVIVSPVAGTTRDAISRLSTMVMMTGMGSAATACPRSRNSNPVTRNKPASNPVSGDCMAGSCGDNDRSSSGSLSACQYDKPR